MLIPTAVLIGALSVPALGGRLSLLADVRLRHAWALAAALGLQVAIISLFPELPDVVAKGAHLASYVLAAGFLCANRRLVGLWVVAVGAAANVIAIAANDGVMPASSAALRAAGRPIVTGEFENSTVVADANFAFLGDVFAVPAGWPLANVFSIGDVLIVVGVTLTLHGICHSRLGRLTSPRPAPSVSSTI